MLKLVIRSRSYVLRTSILQRCSYHQSKSEDPLETKFESTTNYGSYKHTVFTHRLPELTAQQSPLLVALHSRLILPSSFTYSTLSQALNSVYTDGLANNFGLQTLGKSLISYYVSEHLMIKYPRLPIHVLNEAVNSYMGNHVLAEIGKSWGIQSDDTTKLDKFLTNEVESLQYGKLRYLSEKAKSEYKEEGVEELTEEEAKTIDEKSQFYLSKEVSAYAGAVKAVIGGLYTHADEEVAKQFIHDHILSRKVPLEQMFQFSQPSRELVRLCEKLNFTEPIQVRLMAEVGRKTNHAMFTAGVFSGGEQLGQGVGSSLHEAKTRAIVHALMSYYLYSPINEQGDEVKLPSDSDYKFEGIISPGDVSV